MTDFISYVVQGLPIGCVFALVAVGLVLTYKTSGVFNLAFGAQAFVAAVLYYELRVRNHWPTLVALAVVVFVVSPLIGLILEFAIFRHLRTASPIAKLVASLGLLVAVPQFVQIQMGVGSTFGVVGIWWNDDALYHFGDWVLDGKGMAIIVSTLVSTSSGKCMVMNARPGRRPRSNRTGAFTSPRRETMRTDSPSETPSRTPSSGARSIVSPNRSGDE